MHSINLAGNWRFETDPDNKGLRERFFERTLIHEGFKLPGSACENDVGSKPKKYSELCDEAVKCLREKYQYIGPLWLQREIDIPAEYEDKALTLFFERINMSSSVWIDGKRAGREIIELSAPHKYDLTGKLKAGRHTLTVRLDNSNLLNIHTMASGYSDDTQGFWCGITGRMELRAQDKTRIDLIQIFPRQNGFDVKAVVTGICAGPKDRQDIRITLAPSDPDGKPLRADTHNVTLYSSRQTVHLSYEFDEPPMFWDEFHPDLYTLKAILSYGGKENEIRESFGMRIISTENKKILINGRETALRGTLDCGIYPKTGYPPTDLETWLHTMRTIKAYGLNHIRFHAWCPPDAAFTAADMTGVYVLAEMPLWLNLDVCPLETGDDPVHRAYYTGEALAISKNYGNHPSFIMFSNGNELLGDFEMLEDITSQIKAVDNRRLYTLTSNFDRPVTPADDYFCAFEAGGHRIRIQTYTDTVAEHTRLSYDGAVSDMPVPIVSFEIGQYCVYPNVDSIPDFDGNMLPVNFDVIKNDMIKKGIYKKLEKYVKASGMLAALMYKEDIECALRTRGMGGFELLGLTDYTGQSTATIGLLDVFWKSKNIITREKFRESCGSIVPLMKSGRFFSAQDSFSAELDLYDYSENPAEHREFTLELFDGDELLKSVTTTDKHVEFPLGFVKKPSKLTAALSCRGRRNSWDIFVFPPSPNTAAPKILDADRAAIEELIKNGGKAVISGKYLKAPRKGCFRPVFWSPVFFKTDRTCGIICDAAHHAFDKFPTDKYAGFQWKQPLDNSVNADISGFSEDFVPIIETVPNFYDNTPSSPLFEAHIGNADILFCGFDLNISHICVRQLAASLLSYAASDKFAPKQTIDAKAFAELFE